MPIARANRRTLHAPIRRRAPALMTRRRMRFRAPMIVERLTTARRAICSIPIASSATFRSSIRASTEAARLARQRRDDAEAAGGDRSAGPFLRIRELQHPPRRPHARGALDRRLRGGARESPPLPEGADRQGHHLRARRDGGINLVAQSWGRRNVREGDEIVVSHLEHHANIVPWQMLCAEKGARLRVAPVDDRGQIILDEYEKLLGPKTRIVAVTQVSNALGTVTPVHEIIASGASPRRLRARRRRAVGFAYAGRRAVDRLRLLRLLRPQGVRSDRHRRRLRQGRRARTCRRGRAAAI